jgi:hypothetical protein
MSQDEVNALRDQLSIVEREKQQLRDENSALANRAAQAVTQEAHVRELERLQELAYQPCYRCNHKPVDPVPGCPCCIDQHTPNMDGHFTTATADEFAARMEKA